MYLQRGIEYIKHILYLRKISSDTVSLFLPFALLRASTLRPLAVDILSLKPCLLRLFLFDG
jgi:hypothetical protein